MVVVDLNGLWENYLKLFDRGLEDAHDAAADVEATTRAFLSWCGWVLSKLIFRMPGLYDSSQSYIVQEHYIDLASPSRLKKTMN